MTWLTFAAAVLSFGLHLPRRGVNPLFAAFLSILGTEGLPRATMTAFVHEFRRRGLLRVADRVERLSWLADPTVKALSWLSRMLS